VSNISISPQSLSLRDINLIDNQSWHDLITGTVTSADTQMLMMAPYQTVWISNTSIQ
jgi:sucrose phosphorylase